MAWEVHRDAVWMCRDEIRKTKAQTEQKFMRDVKNNRERFCKAFDMVSYHILVFKLGRWI